MKKIEVNTMLCDGCGLCIVNCKYLKENENGNAEYISSKAIKEEDIHIVEKVINECPNNALKLIDTNANNIGFEELKKKFIEELEKIKGLEYPSNSEFKFTKNEYSVDWPDASGERDYDYSSYESAMSAGVKEFDRIMYSKRELIILKLITEWKVKYLKKYYSQDTGNFYEEKNKMISDILLRYVTELNDVTGGKVFCPADFSEFDIYPDKTFMKACDRNEAMGENIVKSVVQEFEKDSYHRLSAYRDYIDTDDREEYVGGGFFGDKYKTKWCYWRVHDAEKELANDILDSIVFADVEELAEPAVHSLIDEYNRNMREELKKKIEIINNIELNSRNSLTKEIPEKIHEDEKETYHVTSEEELVSIVKKIHADTFDGIMRKPEVIIYGYDDDYFIYSLKFSGFPMMTGESEDYYRCNRNNLLSSIISKESHVSLTVYNNKVYYHTSSGSCIDTTKFFVQNFDGSENILLYERKYGATFLDKIFIEDGILYGYFWDGSTGKKGAWKEKIIEV